MQAVSSPENAQADSVSDLLLDARELAISRDGKALLQPLSLQLHRGEVLGLLGLNGAGKSTTMKLLAGVLTPDAGDLTINGHSMLEAPLKARAQVGYLPDIPPVYTDLRVIEYLRLCGQIRAVKGQRLRQRLSDVMEQCQLGEVQKTLIGTLSKGYCQRVGLAQAIIHEPSVVLLDEPGSGLDPQQQDNLHALIRSLASSQAVVFSTHQLSEARAVCDRIAIMKDGQLVADDISAGDDIEAAFRATLA